MQIVDTLTPGGRERVAINLANLLPRERYLVYLCTTRDDGILGGLVEEHVRRLRLQRKGRFDLAAVRHLVKFIRAHSIQILHAHDASLFTAALASLFPPYPAVVWHIHGGRYAAEGGAAWLVWLYRWATAVCRVRGIIGVNQSLAEWSRHRFGLSGDRIWHIPNFVCSTHTSEGDVLLLPGAPGHRIVCVANLRSEKDQITLLRAMAIVVQRMPLAHLLLVGASTDEAYADRIQSEIIYEGLELNVSVLQDRIDVPAILKGCDIGVLSSVSEGLPLALLEYGTAGLPVVATDVGECREVLDGGRAGILVQPKSPDQLAQALLSLLQSPERRSALGKRFAWRVHEYYSPTPIIEQICNIYETVLSGSYQRGTNNPGSL